MKAFLSLLVLRARDPGALAGFYGNVGLVFEKHRHGNGPEHFSAELGGLVLEIYPLKEGDAGTAGLRVGYAVEDVEEAFAVLVTAGGRAVAPPKMSEWGPRAVVDDPAGHRIELTERKRGAQTA